MSIFRRKPVDVVREYESWEPSAPVAGTDAVTSGQPSESSVNQRHLDAAVTALDAADARSVE